MAFIEISASSLPGEAGFVAAANLFIELSKDLTPEQKQELAQRFFEISEPFHKINVMIAANIAKFVAKLLGIKEDQVVVVSAKTFRANWISSPSAAPVPTKDPLQK